MIPAKEIEIAITAPLIKSDKGNEYTTENQKRVENHKKIMAHLEAIAKHIEGLPS